MQMSARGRRLLTEWEGKEREVYKDSGGELTVGVGHLLLPGETYDAPLTDEQIDRLLIADLAKAEAALNACGVNLTQNQFDALVSFIFNVGVPNFDTSTLKKKLLVGDLMAIPTQLARWNKDNGKVSTGLVNRRAKEVALWQG